MFENLPTSSDVFMTWQWDDIEPFVADLTSRPLQLDTIEPWLRDWTALYRLYSESLARLRVATAQDTTDEAAEERLNNYMDTVYPKMSAAENVLKERYLNSHLQVDGMETAMRNMATDAQLFRDENLPLQAYLVKLGNNYSRLTGTITIEWEGEQLTQPQAHRLLQSTDRAVRESAWTRMMAANLAQREAINANWVKLFENRLQQTRNAGYGDDIRAFTWQQKKRFAYSPDDCKQFHAAIEEVVVPAMLRRLEQRKQAMGLDVLHPWDMAVDPNGREPLNPYDKPEDFENGAAGIFSNLDARLAGFFQIMRDEALLDLVNRPGKRLGGFCTSFDVRGVPFIFTNSVGSAADVRVLLHEAGHAFHVFAAKDLPYHQQTDVPMEFAEVASQSMELLTADYLNKSNGGYYDDGAATRAKINQYEMVIKFWPYMAVVDAFQHSVYENPDRATDTAWCDEQWTMLWERFMPGVDWSGHEDALATGWHRKGHIHRSPFYYIEYGLAWVGAVQIWQNALQDRPAAIEQYLRALSLGGTATLPDLFAAAGARFAVDVDTLGQAVEALENAIAELEV